MYQVDLPEWPDDPQLLSQFTFCVTCYSGSCVITSPQFPFKAVVDDTVTVPLLTAFFAKGVSVDERPATEAR